MPLLIWSDEPQKKARWLPFVLCVSPPVPLVLPLSCSRQSDHPELALFTHSETLSGPWVLPRQIVITATWFAGFANLAPFCFPTALQTYILCFQLTRLIALTHTNLWTFLPSYLATFFLILLFAFPTLVMDQLPSCFQSLPDDFKVLKSLHCYHLPIYLGCTCLSSFFLFFNLLSNSLAPCLLYLFLGAFCYCEWLPFQNYIFKLVVADV